MKKAQNLEYEYNREQSFIKKAFMRKRVEREIQEFNRQEKIYRDKIDRIDKYGEKFKRVEEIEKKEKFEQEKAKAITKVKSIDRSIEQGKSVRGMSEDEKKLLNEKFDLKKKYGIEMTDKEVGQKKEIGRIDRDNYYKSLGQSREQDRGMSIGF